MGKCIGTCGHEVSFDTPTIAIKDYSREGGRAVSYPVVCDKCKEMYFQSDTILLTKQAEKDWFDGKLRYSNNEAHCKKSLYKSTYNDNAFTEGYTYWIIKREGNLIWISDDNSNEFSFAKEPELPYYSYSDYFN